MERISVNLGGEATPTAPPGGIAGTAQQDDSFGRALAAGDVNGDGCADLMIGVPMKAVMLPNGFVEIYAGVVHVLQGQYGVPGLVSTGSQVWQQGANGVAGAAEYHDYFGSALAR